MLVRRLVVTIRVSVTVHCPPAKRSVPPPTAPLQALAPSGGPCQAVGERTHARSLAFLPPAGEAATYVLDDNRRGTRRRPGEGCVADTQPS
jgi:hypothetical protein